DRATAPDARNASADANASTSKPNSLIKSGNDSRTDSSSSTTDTRGRPVILNFLPSMSDVYTGPTGHESRAPCVRGDPSRHFSRLPFATTLHERDSVLHCTLVSGHRRSADCRSRSASSLPASTPAELCSSIRANPHAAGLLDDGIGASLRNLY